MTRSEAWKLDRIGSARAGTNPTLLAKMPQSFAVIGDTQFLPGYCVLLVDEPSIDRLTDLSKGQRLEFLDSMDTLGQAVEAACGAIEPGFRRMNYEILGNTDPYLHAHLFPRYEWETHRTSAGRSGSTILRSSTDPTLLSLPATTNSVGVSSPSSPTWLLQPRNALIRRAGDVLRQGVAAARCGVSTYVYSGLPTLAPSRRRRERDGRPH
ncbi:HIT family protein [Paractinoplanes rishiriensis]|uniref:HIT family protein n=1 Tax=Paractinoplanes rishiriensis TaxID=1050105 RepID=UPI001EF25301|nr:hypothetical protein [Actinoplanes rishiriensis]